MIRTGAEMRETELSKADLGRKTRKRIDKVTQTSCEELKERRAKRTWPLRELREAAAALASGGRRFNPAAQAYGNGLESKKTALCSSDAMEFHAKPHPPNLDDVQVDCNWEDVTCPICLDFPHNGVMLQCSSYDKGCRPFMCDTNQAHSNCLERFKSAYGMPIVVKVTSTTHGATVVCIQDISSNSGSRPACPLCRGDVTGWVVIDKARVYLNMKKRCCEEKQCSYIGNFTELQKHAELKHPHSCPSEIDPARQLDWDNFQQSTEIIDVLSTIHAEVPHGVVLGDYVIEYGDAETGDEHEDFPRSRGNWLTSCISCKVFHRGPRSRQRSRRSGRRSSDHSGSDGSNVGENSTRSVDIRGFRFVETDDELPRTDMEAIDPSFMIIDHCECVAVGSGSSMGGHLF
ncbi:hypothetical protein ZIOFF_053520 [Zingiber officinale]|uniref:Uncharacterized protein n=1 Tax=Zingiber officinale TaxID=94328 RepID=A0A8J5F848_ZINOF|nr:hypothetical protein ZIOFF_053520 [Zingiber officinale]